MFLGFYEEALWSKTLVISHDSHIWTNDRPILVLSKLSDYHPKYSVQKKRGQDLKKSLVSYLKSKKQQGPVLKQNYGWCMQPNTTFQFSTVKKYSKVHIFWEGQKFLRNLHQSFVLCIASQIIVGDFAKIFGLLMIYEL